MKNIYVLKAVSFSVYLQTAFHVCSGYASETLNLEAPRFGFRSPNTMANLNLDPQGFIDVFCKAIFVTKTDAYNVCFVRNANRCLWIEHCHCSDGEYIKLR